MEYFKLTDSVDWAVEFMDKHTVPCQNSPISNVFSSFGISAKKFADKANALFSEYHIEVPQEYPKMKGRQVMPWDDFAICVACCIQLRREYDLDVFKILYNELILPNSREGILHATTMSVLALHYLECGSTVIIPKEKKGRTNCDLVIDSISCEVKVVEHSEDLCIGKDRYTGNDISYDIGKFICNRSHKAVRQADLVFADLTNKSFGWMKGGGLISLPKKNFPNVSKNRMIFFRKFVRQLCGHYVDFDPELWQLMQERRKHKFCTWP